MGVDVWQLSDITLQKSYKDLEPHKFEIKLDLYTEFGEVPINLEIQQLNSCNIAKRSLRYLSEMNNFSSPNKIGYETPDLWTIWLVGEHIDGVESSYFHGRILGEHGEDLNFGAHFIFVEYQTLNNLAYPLLNDLCSILRIGKEYRYIELSTDWGHDVVNAVKFYSGDKEVANMYHLSEDDVMDIEYKAACGEAERVLDSLLTAYKKSPQFCKEVAGILNVSERVKRILKNKSSDMCAFLGW